MGSHRKRKGPFTFLRELFQYYWFPIFLCVAVMVCLICLSHIVLG